MAEALRLVVFAAGIVLLLIGVVCIGYGEKEASRVAEIGWWTAAVGLLVAICAILLSVAQAGNVY